MPTSRQKPAVSTLRDLLSSYEDLSELEGEMSDWYDSLPDSLSSSDKANRIEETRDALSEEYSSLSSSCEAISNILENVSGVLDTQVEYTERKMYKGYPEPRWARLSNIVSRLSAAHDHIKSSLPLSLSEEDVESLQWELSQIEDSLSNLEQVEFPTMYG